MTNLSKFFKGAKVLITGHTGFKGSWLAIWLYSLGADIYGISNGMVSIPSHYEATQLKKKITNFVIDIRDREKLKNTIRKYNLITFSILLHNLW